MKNYFAVIDEENAEGKSVAWVYKFNGSLNMISVIKRFPNAKTFTICDTKKQAVETADCWNAVKKQKGVYLFDDAPLF